MSNEKQPLYLQIYDHFKRRIVEHELRPDEKIPTEAEITETFRVSRITVTRALNELAKEGFIYRVRGRGSFVAGEVEETTTSPEQSQSPNRVKKVGLVVPYVEDLFMVRVMKGIQQVLNREGMSLLTVTTGNSKMREASMIPDLLQHGVDGLIVFPADAQIHNEELLNLKMNHFPLVLLDRSLAGIETHFVGSNGFYGAKAAVEYLWDLGHRQIAIISDSALPTTTVSDRFSGYMEGLKAKGGLIDPQLMLKEYRIEEHEKNGKNAFTEFLLERKATAFIALHSDLGVQIYMAAEKAGLTIPDDLSIITFDNPISGFDRFESFTHISQSEQALGEASAKILVDVMNTSKQEEYKKVIFEPKLIEKQTTAPPNKVPSN